MELRRDRSVTRYLQQVQARVKAGASGRTGQQIAEALRRGPGSVEDQFNRQALDSAITGKRSWPAVQPFGDREPSPSALRRSGTLFGAWMGGLGSITNVRPEFVEVGVSGDEVEYAAPQHFGATIRNVRRVFLGLEFGAWITLKKAAEGLTIPARPVGISSQVLDRAGLILLRGITRPGT